MTRIISDLVKIFNSSVSAVIPEKLVKKSVNYNPAKQQLTISGEKYDLHNKNVYLVGMGKAVQSMAKEMENILGPKIKQGIVSIPLGSSDSKRTSKNILYCEGAKNNLPDKNAEATAKKIRELVTGLGADDLLIVLISGGGSALLPLPKSPLTLLEKTALIKNLANSGADITELNVVRKRLSDLKGGQLALKAQPAQVISLILSDIVGDPIDLIASGPTAQNDDDPTLAVNILKKYELFSQLPEAVKPILNGNDTKVELPSSAVRNVVIGSNKISMDAAITEARKLHYLSFYVSDTVTGLVSHVVCEYIKLTKIFCLFMKGDLSINDLKEQIHSNIALETNKNLLNVVDINSKDKDVCLIFGGETTVEVKGSGKGGRNQQFALEFSEALHQHRTDFRDFDIYFLSAGTDGIDGPTDAAGAIGYLHLINEAAEANLNTKKYITENDSYNFYKKFKNGALHVITGHTNTNVMDIHILMIIRKNRESGK